MKKSGLFLISKIRFCEVKNRDYFFISKSIFHIKIFHLRNDSSLTRYNKSSFPCKENNYGLVRVLAFVTVVKLIAFSLCSQEVECSIPDRSYAFHVRSVINVHPH